MLIKREIKTKNQKSRKSFLFGLLADLNIAVFPFFFFFFFFSSTHGQSSNVKVWFVEKCTKKKNCTTDQSILYVLFLFSIVKYYYNFAIVVVSVFFSIEWIAQQSSFPSFCLFYSFSLSIFFVRFIFFFLFKFSLAIYDNNQQMSESRTK